jgi:hypothetical protein
VAWCLSTLYHAQSRGRSSMLAAMSSHAQQRDLSGELLRRSRLELYFRIGGSRLRILALVCAL